MAIQSFLSNVNLGIASAWDIFIILVAIIAVFLYGFVLGKNRIVLLTISSYFSLAITKFMPWNRLAEIEWLGIGQNPSPSLKIIIFIVLILFFFMFIPRSLLSSVARVKKKGDAYWWQLVLLAVLQIGLLISVIVSFLPSDTASDVAPLIGKIFLGEGQQFIWIALPILVISLLRKKKDMDKK